MRPTCLLLLAALVAACSITRAEVVRTDGAPQLPPSRSMPRLITQVPETGATELAFIQVQGNLVATAGDCELRLLREAQQLGANAVLVAYLHDLGGGSSSCHGRAYALTPK